MSTATTTPPATLNKPARPKRGKSKRQAAVPDPPRSKDTTVVVDDKGRYVITTVMKPCKPFTDAQMERHRRREQLSQKGKDQIDKLKKSLREAAEAAHALLHDTHPRGCSCRVCIGDEEFAWAVSAVGGSCDLYLDTLNGYM